MDGWWQLLLLGGVGNGKYKYVHGCACLYVHVHPMLTMPAVLQSHVQPCKSLLYDKMALFKHHVQGLW